MKTVAAWIALAMIVVGFPAMAQDARLPSQNSLATALSLGGQAVPNWKDRVGLALTWDEANGLATGLAVGSSRPFFGSVSAEVMTLPNDLRGLRLSVGALDLSYAQSLKPLSSSADVQRETRLGISLRF